MKKFFRRNSSKKTRTPISASTSDIAAASDANLDVTLKVPKQSGSRASSISLNEGVNPYAYPSIKEKNLKDIFKAVWADDFVKVRNILAKNKSKFDVKDSEKRTPLHLASVKGSQAIMQLLLQKNPDINAVDSHGATPLIKAIQNRHETVVTMLLASKADTELLDSAGMGAIHYATRINWLAGVKSLLKKKANVDLIDSEGNTALHIAADCNCSQICEVLLSNRANVDAQNNHGITSLMVASEQGYEDFVTSLVEGGHADINLKDAEGWTAYDKAQIKAYTSIQKYLKRKERELQGITPSVDDDYEDEDDVEAEGDEADVGGDENNEEDVSQRSQQEGQELSNGGKRRGEAADSWFGDDSDNPPEEDGETAPVLRPSDENQNADDSPRPSNNQLSPRPLSDVGSFDDDSSLSLNFGNNPKKSKPVTQVTANGEGKDIPKAAEEPSENKPAVAVDVHSSSPVKKGIGRVISELEDDSRWDSDTDLKSHSADVLPDDQEKNGNVSAAKNDTMRNENAEDVQKTDMIVDVKGARSDGDIVSLGTEKLTASLLAPNNKDDAGDYPRSSYFDSSEDEQEALEELQQQKLKEAQLKSGGVVAAKVDESDDDTFGSTDLDMSAPKDVQKKVDETDNAYQLPTLSPMYGSYGLADDMEDNWDSDLSERQPQTEETNMNVQASNVLESTPEGILRPPSISPFDSEDELDSPNPQNVQDVGTKAAKEDMQEAAKKLQIELNGGLENNSMFGRSSPDSTFGSTEQSDNENDGSKSGTIKRVEPKATGGLGFNIIGAANAPNIPDEKDNIEKESQKDLNELNNNLIGGGGQYANADDEVDDDDDVDQTETTGSWLVDKNKKDKQNIDKPLDAEEPELQVVLEDSLVNVDVLPNNIEASVDVFGSDPDHKDEFDSDGLESDDEIENGFKAGMGIPTHAPTSVAVVPSGEGGGDRIPSTPLPSKNVEQSEKKPDQRKSVDIMDLMDGSALEPKNTAAKFTPSLERHEFKPETVGNGGDINEQLETSANDVTITSEEDDEVEGQVSASQNYNTPRLLDLKKKVSSSSGLVELKNQFREQNRVLEQERVDKQQTEKRAKAFEQQVETLNAYVKSSLVVAL
ncbi:uncharacterized protein LOC142353605 isoform X2 [Convolutriloba macropyga]|uniref:uncharacterized protein LOC142353605 isoform X2 n=1 Tax=Convolutriloba macropyga TaxID=536237 RepID=UPI003F5247B1